MGCPSDTPFRKREKMKTRTIEELHDKYIGHRKFAKICDLLIEKGYKITDIKEYNEQFTFKVDGYQYTFMKSWKSSAKDFATYFENVFKTQQDLMNKTGSTWRI